MSDRTHTRRHFVASLTAALAALATGATAARGGIRLAEAAGHCAPSGRPRRAPDGHPTPRTGVNAARVVPRADLADEPDLAEVFDMVREMPQIADGIRCRCGCAEVPGYYSLLSCFEGDGMAKHCELCQSQARLAHRLHAAGRSLDQIRAALDAEFA